MKKKLFTLALLINALFISSQNRFAALEPCMKPFYHGVASGDPLTDKVIIWTRVTPDTNQIGNAVSVNWRIATDTGMANIIGSGSVSTDSSLDYTVKVDVSGLQPNTFYFYEFEANGYNSIRGRTKTIPLNNADSLRFAVVSCANYEAGYFNSYASLLQRNDFDGVFAIGDYIYEYENGGYAPNAAANRHWQPANEILTLADYRTRYSTYRLDDDLRKLHQQYPFTIVWDDHEFANDAWMNGAQNHTTATEGSWAIRKANGKKSFFEWQPIRPIVTAPADTFHIYRTFNYGGLVDFIMLDTRIHGRELQSGTTGTVVTSPTRQLLGSDQYTWLCNKLDSSTAKWKVLGQQVMMAPLKVFGQAINGDQWDGYPAQRDSVFNHIINHNIIDVVVITGDIHSSWANDLPTASYNSSTGAGSAGVEFVSPSVTSPGTTIAGGATLVMASNSHIKFADLTQHGYTILDINKKRTQSDWYFVATLDSANPATTYASSYYVNDLQRHLKHATGAAVPRSHIAYVNAPFCPRPSSTTSLQNYSDNNVLLGFYPNPVYDFLTLQYYNSVSSDVVIKVYDINGKLVQENAEGKMPRGVFKTYVNIQPLQAGSYILQIESASGVIKQKFIKD